MVTRTSPDKTRPVSSAGFTIAISTSAHVLISWLRRGKPKRSPSDHITMATHPAKRVGGTGTEINTLAHLSLAPPILSSGSLHRTQSLAHTSEDGADCPEQILGSRPSSFPASVPALVHRKALPSGIFDQEDRASGEWTLSRRHALARARSSGNDGLTVEVEDPLDCDVTAVTGSGRISLKDVPRFSKVPKKVALASSASDSWRARSSPIARCPSIDVPTPIARCPSSDAHRHRAIATDPGTPSKMLLAFESVEDWGRSSSSESLEAPYGAGFNALSTGGSF